MQSALILFEELPGKEGKLGLITLNRSQALNALTHEMIVLMHRKLIEWENAHDIKAVVIRAAEGRAFCAGGDLRLVYEKHALNDPTLPNFFRDEYRLNHYLFHYSKPYISFLDGITMGGGAGISINGSHCVGTERLLFAMPETGIGFFPDVGATYFLSRLPYGLGFYLGLTGARLSCDDSLGMKLIHYKILSENLPIVLKALAETPFRGQAHEAVNHILTKFHQEPQLSPLTAYYPFINRYFLKHSVEEILMALEAEGSSWHKETAAILAKKSPTSLKVTLRQLHEGLKRDFDQCMQLEYHLMCHFIQGHDFFEGIRAVLIEKTQSPAWQPAELHAISSTEVEAFFMPLAGEAAQLLFT
jgi:enoyl-CoA hydratase